ncbi:hypothetical protein SDC9_89600 [bioreactor metagenome]|uniref:Uncharacterized protein n=1 Tax=bioreactor metagenome TaxID=1076179 RepID=A0A644ZRC1_9ZZZZ
MVMLQGDCFNPGQPGDLQVLKSYVWSKLLWNPELDAAALENEFVDGYYGCAAPMVREYLALRRKSAAGLKEGYDCFTSDAPWLSDRDLLDGIAILEQAKAAAASDPVIAERVDTLAKPFEFLLLGRASRMQGQPGCPSVARLQQYAGEWLNFMERKKITHWAEEWGPESAISGIRAALKLKSEGRSLTLRTPEFLRRLQAEGKKYYCFEEDAFVIHGGAKMAEIVADPAASNGAAIALHHVEFGWSPKLYYMPPMQRGKRYDCYIALRLDKPATGDLCQFSAWNGKDVFLSTHFDAAKLQTGRYTYLPAGRLTVPEAGYSFIAATVNPEIRQTYVDHMVLVEVDEASEKK